MESVWWDHLSSAMNESPAYYRELARFLVMAGVDVLQMTILIILSHMTPALCLRVIHEGCEIAE